MWTIRTYRHPIVGWGMEGGFASYQLILLARVFPVRRLPGDRATPERWLDVGLRGCTRADWVAGHGSVLS